MIMEKTQENIFCICGRKFIGYGYNPYPVKEEGRCCKLCNYTVVLEERLNEFYERQNHRKKMNKKVYISGAIAHYDLEERKAAFGNAERFLALKGYNPVNPFKNGLPDEAHWREHMRADIALLLGCDYIYMLRGWELSKGAKLELDVASSCGIKVLFE